MGSDMIRVLIADDHPIVREGLASLVTQQSDMTLVGEAGNGQEAVALFLQHTPDIMLMDLRMPIMDGKAALTAIRVAHPDARIILLTSFEGEDDIYQALRAGAKAYLLKDAPRETLLTAIRTVYQGQSYLPPEITTKLMERVNTPELTTREVEVLRLIATGHSNQEIGNLLFITEGTVKAHVNSILNKLGVRDRTQAALLALKRGIIKV